MTKLVRRIAGTPLSEEAIQDLRNLAAMSDEKIDVSDIPPTPPEFWSQGSSALDAPSIQVSLDTDIVEFFRSQGKPLKVVINAALRKIIQSETSAGTSKEMQKKAS
jgi:uncharacterized protein (DUF4415 family)